MYGEDLSQEEGGTLGCVRVQLEGIKATPNNPSLCFLGVWLIEWGVPTKPGVEERRVGVSDAPLSLPLPQNDVQLQGLRVIHVGHLGGAQYPRATPLVLLLVVCWGDGAWRMRCGQRWAEICNRRNEGSRAEEAQGWARARPLT